MDTESPRTLDLDIGVEPEPEPDAPQDEGAADGAADDPELGHTLVRPENS